MSIRTPYLLFGLAALALGHGPPASAQGLRLVQVVSGFDEPTDVTSPPDDPFRLFVTEQNSGLVRIVKGDEILPQPFLDLGALVVGGGERGLLGIAFHPDYSENRRFYVSYTDLVGASVLREYLVSAANPDVADPASFKTIFGPLPQPADNHNGGCIQFGPDGMLYYALGDGGPFNDINEYAQNLSVPFGKLLRLDLENPPSYVPADNPFVGDPNAEPLIWSYGLRNHWRFSFDRQTGDVWIADVGKLDREEIDYQPASSTGGENYGWRCMEGTVCTGLSGCTCNHPSLVLPVHEYDHTEGDCAIIGGFVYRGPSAPSAVGRYFFADACTSRIWSFRPVGGVATDLVLHREFHSVDSPLTNTAGAPRSFGEDSLGNLYLVTASGGRLWRLEDAQLESGFETYCGSYPNSTGARAKIGASGSTSLFANDLEIEVTGAVPGQFGVAFYGGVARKIPWGDGLRCAASGGFGIHRLLPAELPQPDGTYVRRVDFSEHPANAGAGRIEAGSTWYFQYWYRDPLGPQGTGFNTSDGLEVQFVP